MLSEDYELNLSKSPKSLHLSNLTGRQACNANTHHIPFVGTKNICTKKSENVVSSPNLGIQKVKKLRNSSTSSDEERWLTAIETGKLEDVDEELKKIKDPKFMTARQRALYERTQDTDISGFVEKLIALPTGYKEREKPQTAEEIQKAILKSQKRKLHADQRREKDKLKTMERLLKKQESTKHRSWIRNKPLKTCLYPKITYISAIKGNYLIVPPGQEFPQMAKTNCTTPLLKLCHVNGCKNRKAYNCSTTKVPLCSLNCYRKNIVDSLNQ
ncbi:INO80 complex subunit B isoform X2 [Drosophila eugracilis]|uniref:INO80 complex subunit B isoform X2 n=1 Tax=Drosophila eugracilis TaxID=29029 RepID=UPI001BDA4146|nr:INO80 complex subunit B isoform X2 [Drosophila eugracilis]